MRLPEEMASGSWDVSTNLWNCNTELFNCMEVDFQSEDKKLKAAWLVSYSRSDGQYCCNRTLNDETMMLFTEKPVSIKVHPVLSSEAQMLVYFVRQHRVVDPNSIVPHTAEPLHMGGDWTASYYEETEHSDYDPVHGDLRACKEVGAKCSKVIYKWTDETGMYQQTCVWLIASHGSGMNIIGANRQAYFFFKTR